MPAAVFAVRVGVSQGTLVRLEKGDPGVAVGAVAMAFLALGELHRIGSILDVSTDDTGLRVDIDSLPQRIHKAKPLILTHRDLESGNE